MRLLLATDGSEFSETAARYLERLDMGRDNEIIVLHVLKEYLIPDSVDAGRDFVKVGMKGAEALVDEFRQRLQPAAGRVETSVREGEPWREILEGARDFSAEVVVLGHRGLTDHHRFALGSVSQEVLRHGDVSVLVVRGLPPLDRPLRVLFCTDGSTQSVFSRGLFMSMMPSTAAEIHVLSVVDMEVTSLPEKYYPEDNLSKMLTELRGYSMNAAGEAVSKDATALRERFSDVSEEVVFGVTKSEILNASERIKADLIVIGSRDLHGIKGMLLGSVAAAVSRHADCSVLVAKNHN